MEHLKNVSNSNTHFEKKKLRLRGIHLITQLMIGGACTEPRVVTQTTFIHLADSLGDSE
jgi:hypothetical protein